MLVFADLLLLSLISNCPIVAPGDYANFKVDYMHYCTLINKSKENCYKMKQQHAKTKKL